MKNTIWRNGLHSFLVDLIACPPVAFDWVFHPSGLVQLGTHERINARLWRGHAQIDCAWVVSVRSLGILGRQRVQQRPKHMAERLRAVLRDFVGQENAQSVSVLCSLLMLDRLYFSEHGVALEQRWPKFALCWRYSKIGQKRLVGHPVDRRIRFGAVSCGLVRDR